MQLPLHLVPATRLLGEATDPDKIVNAKFRVGGCIAQRPVDKHFPH
ncbi:hypothetical protein [Streptomyces sp. NPDC088261]